MSAEPGSALEVKELSLSFVGLRALDGVSLRLPPGRIVGLIGPNGAGKTTLLNCLSRIYTPDSGRIHYGDVNLLELRIHAVSGVGISRTFQNLELAAGQTVRENILPSAQRLYPSSLFSQFLSLPAARAQAARADERVELLLAEFGLTEVADVPVSELSYGVQKGVELVRAVAGDPSILLLDEPAAGLNHEESRQLGVAIKELRDRRGMGVLLVEHDMRLVMDVCDEIVVLDHGQVLTSGTPSAIQGDPRVIDAYLGAQEDA